MLSNAKNFICVEKNTDIQFMSLFIIHIFLSSSIGDNITAIRLARDVIGYQPRLITYNLS